MVMINCSKLCASLQEKSNQLTLCQRCKSENLRLYSIVYVYVKSLSSHTAISRKVVEKKKNIKVYATRPKGGLGIH